jgi:hypothetical protein
VPEVLGDQSRVAELLAYQSPRYGRWAWAVTYLSDPGARGRPADDDGEDRLRQASTGTPAEDRVGRLRLTSVAEVPRLSRETSQGGVAPWLSALVAVDKQTTCVRRAQDHTIRARIAPSDATRRDKATNVSWSRSARPGRFRAGRPAPRAGGGTPRGSANRPSWRGFGGGLRFRDESETAVSPPPCEPDEAPANRIHRKSPVAGAFPVAGL